MFPSSNRAVSTCVSVGPPANLALLSPTLGWMELSEQRFVSSEGDAIVGRALHQGSVCALVSLIGRLSLLPGMT
jgi:hypothetical protein